MSERNTGYQFVSTDTEAVESLLISIYEKITGVSVKPASPEKLFIQFVAAVVIQERGLNNYTGNQNIPSRAEGLGSAQPRARRAVLCHAAPGGAGCGLHRALPYLRGTDHGDPHSCRYARH